MDANVRNIRQIDVDNLDEEITSREMMGWTASIEDSRECAILTRGDEQIKICELPQHRRARLNSEGLAGISSGDTPC